MHGASLQVGNGCFRGDVLTRYDLTAEPLIGGQQEAIARLRLRPLYTFGRDSDAVALACRLYDGCRALLEEESRMAS